MSAPSELGPWLFLAIALLGVVVLGWLWWRRPSSNDRLEADACDPYRRWVQNVFLLVTTDIDYGHLPGAEARRILAHWWDVYGPLEHRRTLELLGHAPRQDHAWDLVRFILVSRLGAAASLCDDQVSWAEILPIARRLQAAYSGWRPMARAYLLARRQSKGLPLDGCADDHSMQQLLDNLARLDDSRWAEQPFETPLRIDDEVNDG